MYAFWYGKCVRYAIADHSAASMESELYGLEHLHAHAMATNGLHLLGLVSLRKNLLLN